LLIQQVALVVDEGTGSFSESVTLTFKKFDPAECDFPKAHLPMTPVLQLRLAVGRREPYATIFAKSPHIYQLGRYALAGAMHAAGVGTNSAVLLPSYHCRTMIDPAVHLGAEVLLYPLNPDLTLDLSKLDSILTRSTAPIKALVLPHFFGWPQPVISIRNWCKTHNIKLIEDCAHRPWGTKGSALPGEMADFAIASPYKLVASAPFGVLWSKHDISECSAMQRPSIALEIKSTLLTLAKSYEHYRTRSKPGVSDLIDGGTLKFTACGRDIHTAAMNNTSSQFNALEATLSGLACPRIAFRMAPFGRISTRRRQRYLEWAASLKNLEFANPLFDELPPHVVPAFFPLLIHYPTPHFFMLKRMGVPIWRWDDLAASPCETADHYRLHLLHFPCHQALSDQDMAWMTSVVHRVLSTPPNKV